MGKQKQQVISRFFAPKPKPSSPSDPDPNPNPNHPSTPPPKISATVYYSPAKRKLLSDQLAAASSSPKKPKSRNIVPDQDLHQRFLQKLLEPTIEISASEPSTESSNPSKKYTPLEQQVVDLKSNYPDVLLMIEVGYKYRFFGQDAQIAARVLGIYAHMNHNFMTASIPTFRLNVHVRRLVSAGYKVGVVKQTETAAIKAHGSNRVGPFCRGLSALYTKATLEAAEDIEGGGDEGFGNQSKYLMCIVDKDVKCDVGSGFDVRIGIVAVEISTGDVVHGEFSDDFMRSGLEAAVLSLAPAELLLGEPLSKQTEKFLLGNAGPASNVRVEHASRVRFNEGGALAEVISLYEENIGTNGLEDDKENATEPTQCGESSSAIQAIMNMSDLAVQALALTLNHLKQFGFERILCLGASFRSLSNSTEMTLSVNTLQQLEVLRNNSDGSESGSLLHTMNHTLTVYGSRLLRHWVTHPLCDRNMISARLNAVSEIVECMGSCRSSQILGEIQEEDSDAKTIKHEFYYLLSSVLATLSKSPDLQRGITRIFHRTAKATEFIAVIQATLNAGKQLQRLCLNQEDAVGNAQTPTIKSSMLKKLISTVSSSIVVGNAAKLLSSLNKEAAERGDLHNILITSCDQFPELAVSREAVQVAKEKLESLIGLLRKKLSIPNLEFLSVSGSTHLIELPTNVKVPLNWVKVNSTKKTIRYHPPEVLAGLDELSLANERLGAVSRASWDSFLKSFAGYYAEFQAAVHAIAALDCLQALATLARNKALATLPRNKNYVQPVFVEDDEPVQIRILSGRHPVLETILQDNFVPNDTNLNSESEYCQIVTGPNMGGKSCYIRQVALISIMAQVGSFVPATSARLQVLDNIYTRMGASDSIQQGRSTFLEELSETSNIIRTCSSRSLVIIDELGRGTSTHDGVAIAYATLRHLLEQKRCLALFVTHYPKICDIVDEFPGSAAAYHVSYLTAQSSVSDHEDVTYLYKVVPGVCERSFGFKVARLAQIPSSCITRAIDMATKLEAEVDGRGANKFQKSHFLKDSETQKMSSDSLEAGTSWNPAELIDVYRDFFMNFKSSLSENDPAKSFLFLKLAKQIAVDSIKR